MLLFKIPGFVSDNEDFTFDKSSSGSGCCEITTVSGLCDVSFLVN